MSDNRKNWIITDHGDLINLDFLSKVMVLPTGGTDLVLFHGIAEGKGSTIKYKYLDNASAVAARNKILQTMMDLNIITNLQSTNAYSFIIAPATGSVAGGDAITLTGNGFFTSPFALIINGQLCTSLVVVNANTITAATPANAAGTYGVEYSDTHGNIVSLTNGFTYS